MPRITVYSSLTIELLTASFYKILIYYYLAFLFLFLAFRCYYKIALRLLFLIFYLIYVLWRPTLFLIGLFRQARPDVQWHSFSGEKMAKACLWLSQSLQIVLWPYLLLWNFQGLMWGKKNTILFHFWSWVFNRFKVCPCTGTTAILVSSFFNHFRVKNTFSLFKSHALFILKRVFIKVLKLFECISNHCRTCSYCAFCFTQRILFHLP